MKKTIALSATCLMLAGAAFAGKVTDKSHQKVPDSSKEIPFSTDTMSYVEGNVLATFYHEFGHALIDLMHLPVFAREEDAADSFALVLTEILHDPLRAEQITWASADQYVQLARKSKGVELDFSDTHSPDMMRYYTLICLYYGGDVNARQTFAEDNALPEDRADFCEDERAMVESAWTRVLRRIERDKSGDDWIVVRNVDESADAYVTAAQQVIRNSIAVLNETYDPGFTVNVDLVDCDEDNAFYDSNDQTIIMCNEYVPPLTRAFPPL